MTLMVQLAPTAREAPQLFVCAKLALATIDAMFSSAAPVFVNVTGCGALVVVTVWVAKVRVVGKRVTVGAGPPIPLNEIVCGLFAALSVMVTDPYRLPLAVGAKVMLRVQLAPLPTLEPHELVSAKSPVVETLVMIKGEPPMLFKFTDSGVLVVPTTWEEKVRLEVERLTAGAATPVPVSSTT